MFDDLEAKRMMLEKMRKFGSEKMLEGLKKKPDLSITIAAGPVKPDNGMDEEAGEPPHMGMAGMHEEMGEPEHEGEMGPDELAMLKMKKMRMGG